MISNTPNAIPQAKALTKLPVGAPKHVIARVVPAAHMAAPITPPKQPPRKAPRLMPSSRPATHAEPTVSTAAQTSGSAATKFGATSKARPPMKRSQDVQPQPSSPVHPCPPASPPPSAAETVPVAVIPIPDDVRGPSGTLRAVLSMVEKLLVQAEDAEASAVNTGEWCAEGSTPNKQRTLVEELLIQAKEAEGDAVNAGECGAKESVPGKRRTSPMLSKADRAERVALIRMPPGIQGRAAAFRDAISVLTDLIVEAEVRNPVQRR